MARVIAFAEPLSVLAAGALLPRSSEPDIWEAGDGTGERQAGGESMDLESWRQTVRRTAGVPRARSAAFATSCAVALARALVGNRIADPSEAGVVVASSTATAAVAYQYETIGLRDGWHLVDPFGLPNSIPSALAAHVAMALQLKSFAVTLLDAHVGYVNALTYAALTLSSGRATYAVAMRADEYTDLQAFGAAALGEEDNALHRKEGACGMFLGVRSPTRWHLEMVAAGVGDVALDELPPTWRDAEFHDASSLDSSSIRPSHAAAQHAGRFVLVAQVSGYWRMVGFSMTETER